MIPLVLRSDAIALGAFGGLLTHGVSLAAAITNLGGAVLIVAWLVGGIETDGPGAALLVLLAVVGGADGAVEASSASRSVAMLVPGD